MINAIGYTQDGFVWMEITAQINELPYTGVFTFTPQAARELANGLLKSSEQAETSIGKTNERDRKHDH